MKLPRSRFLRVLANFSGMGTLRGILPIATGVLSGARPVLTFTTVESRFLPIIQPDTLLIFDVKGLAWEGGLP